MKLVKEKVALWAREKYRDRDSQLTEDENFLEAREMCNEHGFLIDEDLCRLMKVE